MPPRSSLPLQNCSVTWWPCPSQAPCYGVCGPHNISLNPSAPVNASTGVDTCGPRPPYSIQGCPWNSNLSFNALGSSILNEILQVILPGPLTFTEYPIACSPGIRGATAVDLPGQSSPFCSGFCDPGFYCPTAATITPVPCPSGSFCPPGSALPQLCPGGTHSNSTHLSSASACMPCPPGSACPAGSLVPASCLPGSIAASFGAEACTTCAGGTFQPYLNGTSCLPCERGSVCPQGASAPLSCTKGRREAPALMSRAA